VAAIALFDAGGRLLLQRRPVHKHHGGLWELPGGKVEPGETPRQALARELAEELAIRIDPQALEPALLADETLERHVVLLLYRLQWAGGAIVPLERQEWGWFAPLDAGRLDLAPMDRCLVDRLFG
jgi:8-oxo-dGTP diphosphatase